MGLGMGELCSWPAAAMNRKVSPSCKVSTHVGAAETHWGVD